MRRNHPVSTLAAGAVVAALLCALLTPPGWLAWLPVVPALVIGLIAQGASR